MRPIDFVVFDGDSEPNRPAHEVADAMMQDLVVHAADGEWYWRLKNYETDQLERRI